MTFGNSAADASSAGQPTGRPCNVVDQLRTA